MNRYRKFVTSGLGFCFAVVGSSGLFFQLFYKPHTLEEIHTWVGITMVALALLHIYQNGKPLKTYLKQPRVYLMLLPVLLISGFFVLRPEPQRGANPRQVVSKLSAASIADLSRVFGRDPAAMVAAMKADGIALASEKESLKSVAQANHKPPEALLEYFVTTQQ